MRITVPVTNHQAWVIVKYLNEEPCLAGAIIYPGNQHRQTRLAVAGTRTVVEEVGRLIEAQAFTTTDRDEAEDWMILSGRILHPSALA